MISTWILIAALYSGGSSSTDFNSKEACQAAAAEFQRQATNVSIVAVVFCAKK